MSQSTENGLSHLARRLFARCACRWEPANVLGLDEWERVSLASCPRHNTRPISPIKGDQS